MSAVPIFIHSLFRSGSTYLFKVFRRSPAGYWCYQEPLHEAVLGATEAPHKLLHDRGDELVKELRHPSLGEGYFQELVEVWPAWKNTLLDRAVYDGYFAPPNEDFGISYLRALIAAAKGRPVLQECRSPGRIAAIKTEMGGSHIYLWRNPWDQWWSYKVARYFEVANLLIINAPNAPMPVQLMLDAQHIDDWSHKSIAEGFDHYWNKTSTAEESYSIFYLLWCLGMHEGINNADFLLSIDRLSDSADYQSEMLSRLKDSGIDGIDFSDCRVPQGRYLEKDCAFFDALEGRVHQWLVQGGWSKQDIDQIQTFRRQYQPASWNIPVADLDPADLTEQAVRARELAKRFETSMAERARYDAIKLSEVESLAQQFEVKARQAESRESEAKAQVQQALEVARQSQWLAQHAETRAQQAESRESEAKANTQQALEAARQAQELAQQAEIRAQKAGSGESEAKAKTQQALEAARQAQEIAQQAEARAQQALTQLGAVYACTSWRITAPWRSVGRVVKRLRGGQVISNLSPDSTPPLRRRAMVFLVNWGVSYARKSPRFRRLVLGVLSRFPGLSIKLRQMHIGSQLTSNSRQVEWTDNQATNSAGETTVHLGGDVTHSSAMSVPDGINARQRTPLEAYFHAYRGHE